MTKKLHVVGTIIENDNNEILLLLKNKNRPEGEKWGPPGGRVEKNETLQQAAAREINEEIGVRVNSEDLSHIRTLYWDIFWKNTTYLITYESFCLKLKNKIEIKLKKDENTDYFWINPYDAYKRSDLMKGAYMLLEDYLDISSRKKI